MAQNAARKDQPAEQANDHSVSPLAGGTKIDMQQCYSCGGAHEGVPCVPYRKANPPWTHWCACPETGDPMPLAIVLYAGHPMEVNNRILQDVARAQANNPRIIFATLYVSKRGTVEVDRHCHDFPIARFEEAMNVLRGELAKDAPLAEPTGPLPRADLSLIFGRNHPPMAAHAAADVAEIEVEDRNGAGTPDEESDDEQEADECDD